jgi:hypothetical protein
VHLLSTIERYLGETGVTASRFGREALGNPGFVHWLRRGREPRETAVRRIVAYLSAVRHGSDARS